MKVCIDCEESKPIEAYHRMNTKNGHWYRRMCKPCANKRYYPPTGKENTGRFKKGNVSWNTGTAKEKIPKERKFSSSRKSVRYKKWREECFKRDGEKCTLCGITEDLHVHHKTPWKESVELRFDLDNGITLCRSCHRKEEHKVNPQKSYWKGKKMSAEHVKKMADKKRGGVPWNKGKITPPPSKKICCDCSVEKDIHFFTPQGKWYTNRCKACRNEILRRKRIGT